MTRPAAAAARPGLFRAHARRSRHRVLHRQPYGRRAEAHEAAETSSRSCATSTAATIGAEFAHVSDSEERLWLQDQFQNERIKRRLQRRGAPQHPVAADRGRRPRALPAHQVRRPEALLARRRRGLIAALDDLIQQRRRGGHRGGRHRHGAPRPPQRAGQRARQVARGAVLRVRGRITTPSASRARATSSTTRASPPTCAPPSGNVHVGAGLQPLAPRGRQPGRRRLGARPPGAPRRYAGRRACCRC